MVIQNKRDTHYWGLMMAPVLLPQEMCAAFESWLLVPVRSWWWLWSLVVSIFFISAPLLGTIKKYSLLFVSLSGCFMCFIFQTLFLMASVYPALGCHIFETIPGFGVVCKAAGTHRQLMQMPSMTAHPVAAPATCSCRCSCPHILSIHTSQCVPWRINKTSIGFPWR